MQTCTSCRRSLSRESFYKQREAPSNRHSHCKDCRARGHKAYHWWNTYRLRPEDVAHLYNNCGHKCEICGTPEAELTGKNTNAKALNIDHCHETGKVRGLLCFNCNACLGKAKDSVETLEKLIVYLQRG